MRLRIGTLVALVVALGLVAASCSSGSSSGGGSSGGGSLTINGDKANNHGSKDVSSTSSATLDATNSGTSYFFAPTVLTGKAGEKLTLTVKNTGDTVHNFTLVGGGANQNIQPGQSTTVTVTFPKSGSMEFYCAIHRSFGMVGELSTA